MIFFSEEGQNAAGEVEEKYQKSELESIDVR